jgi:hypothetical protein
MQKIIEVDEAKAIMTEGIDWSVLKWLREKKTVRKMADRANAALDATILKIKTNWDKDLQFAFDQLGTPAGKAETSKFAPELLAQAKKLRHAADDAKRARDDAENTFDEAEKRLSTTMAREGARKAIRSWELHEHMIRLSEAAAQANKAKA